MKRFRKFFPVIAVILFLGLLVGIYIAINRDPRPDPRQNLMGKPVIYLYPPEKMDVRVELECTGDVFVTYPRYDDGWEVTAYPDGTIINKADNAEYSYLFWEAHANVDYDFSTGFVVKGADTEAFLKEKLAFMGLTPKEYNEFIVYWMPKMMNNPYNLISFQQEAYTDNAVLTITPEPDSMLRVFMAYKPLNKPIEIPEQQLQPFERVGFTVVEWGGNAIS